MTSKQFRAAIKRLRMSQSQAAAYLRVTEGAVSLWVNGKRPVPGPVAVLLEQRAEGGK